MPDLKDIPARGEVILKGDPRIETYRRDAVLTGNPDAVVRARDWQEVAEILAWCNGNGVPVTVCGARTSMAGSAAAMEGVLLTTDHFNKIVDIGVKDGRACAVVEPGVIVKDFQTAVEEKGFHYPVVPTSCDDAFVAGTVSTNATGEDFYKYGPTRSFVEAITFIRMDGSTGSFERKLPPPKPSKGLGGYFMSGEEIDRLIGSEGTLAVIKEIRFSLLDRVPNVFAILAPFPTRESALGFIDKTNSNNWHPRSIEYIDSFALSLMKTSPSCPKFDKDASTCLYIKDETFGEPVEPLMELWFERISVALEKTPHLLEEAIIGVTQKDKEKIHGLRHQIPTAILETTDKYEKDGGGKISGDWWVPKDKMLETVLKVYEEVDPLKIDFTTYGHLGDGHPHSTFLCRTPDEKALAHDVVTAQARRAVSLGGGVAGEHGIGKIKHDLLSIQYTPEAISKMRRIKDSFDPKWLLGKGNIFASKSKS